MTVVGHSATIAAGEWITATGEWVNDRTHGQQFKARFLRTSAPTSTEGIEKYLSSGMIRGIGPVYAKKLVRAFAEKVFDIIEAEPDRLREVDGIGPVRAPAMKSRLAHSFDHLVGAQQDRWGYLKTERLGGLKIHDHLKFCRKLHREIARLRTAKDAIDISGGPTKGVYLVDSV